ncbi:MAG TPA: ABC transporter permease [Gammaproteobacteria bacterium]|nr:ABC transporter permease [Gammaproteobacteria bacterium]
MQKSKIYYDSNKRGLPLVEEFKELLRYRELLFILIINNIKSRYKRSTFGVLWTMLNPLLYMAVMVVAFSHLFRFQIVNYPVYLLSGLIAWNFFSQTTTQAMGTLVWGGSLLKRIYIPRTIFAVAAIGSGIINLALSCIPLILIMLITHQPIYATWFFTPISILILGGVSLGVALIVSMIAIFFTDIVELYQVLLQAAFYLTPIMYPETALPENVQRFLVLNPMYDVVKVFRGPIYDGHLPSQYSLCAAVIATLVVLLFGWWFFTRTADQISYRI